MGAARAAGPTVVIDVFRAFSAAAYAFDAGVQEILLAAEVDEAYEIAAGIPNSVLMGEESGIRPKGFQLGNSPGEILETPVPLAGRTIVHRSSAGTRCARAALNAGAAPLYVASMVVASATAAAVRDEDSVTIVASGLTGVDPAIEDELCADAIVGLLEGDNSRLATAGVEAAGCARAATLREADFAHPDDVALCTEVDRFSFAMQAAEIDGLVRVHRVEV